MMHVKNGLHMKGTEKSIWRLDIVNMIRCDRRIDFALSALYYEWVIVNERSYDLGSFISNVMFLVLVPSQNGAHYGARMCGSFFTHHIPNETT